MESEFSEITANDDFPLLQQAIFHYSCDKPVNTPENCAVSHTYCRDDSYPGSRILLNKQRNVERDKTRCASFISLSRRSPHTNTSHSAAAHCSRKKTQPALNRLCFSQGPESLIFDFNYSLPLSLLFLPLHSLHLSLPGRLLRDRVCEDRAE